nr:protein nlp9 [Quercus suber]
MSVDEKMLKALSLFKASSGGGILAQVLGSHEADQHILSTCEQPYLLDEMLAGYREISRSFVFPTERRSGSFLGLPVFDSPEMACCAVLELVTPKERSNFNAELETVCNAFQAVNLRTTEPPHLRPQCLSKNQRAALVEIIDVLRAVCHAHRLPLARTCIPCYYTEGAGDEMTRVLVREGNTNSNEKCILCIKETACYVNDRTMEVLIRLRSTYTGEDDYILELFLPVNMRGSAEQQLLLNNLSGTMQRICKSLRTVSDAELLGVEVSKAAFQKEEKRNFPLMAMPGENPQLTLSDNDVNSTEKMPLEVSNTRNDGIEPDSLHKQVMFLVTSAFLFFFWGVGGVGGDACSNPSETEKSMPWLMASYV